mmetsp:Transcript_173401/g.556214  ORF Transcript_173401/g.556214 Transcript_173401/m.556214 type:complete len:96 (-) Transcript_173401:868-1155(-)
MPQQALQTSVPHSPSSVRHWRLEMAEVKAPLALQACRPDELQPPNSLAAGSRPLAWAKLLERASPGCGTRLPVLPQRQGHLHRVQRQEQGVHQSS